MNDFLSGTIVGAILGAIITAIIFAILLQKLEIKTTSDGQFYIQMYDGEIYKLCSDKPVDIKTTLGQ